MGDLTSPGPRCVRCDLPEDDAVHQGTPRGVEAHAWDERIEQHNFDPGERRRATRRSRDRQDEAWAKAREAHDAAGWNKEHPEGD